MTTIAITNQKDGTGKTTIAFNLIGGFNYHFPNKKKLAIDLDPQGILTSSLYKNPVEIQSDKAVNRWFKVDEYKGADVIHRTRYQNVDIIPTNISLFEILQDRELMSKNDVIRDYLAAIENMYDVVVIDTPSSIGSFVLPALMAADYQLIPVDLDELTMTIIAGQLKLFEEVKQENPKLEILGILPNQVNKKLKIQNEILAELQRSAYKEFLLDEYFISTNEPLRRAEGNRKTIFEADKKARSYKQLKELTEWICGRCGLGG